MEITIAQKSSNYFDRRFSVVSSSLKRNIFALKMNFSKEDMVKMIYCLGASEENCLLASRVYAQRYPDAERHPNRLAFERLKERFERTGN